jgi:DNA-binding PadR family transcriptional regulator
MAERYGTHERAALLLLLVEGREIPNADMRNDYGIELTPTGRAKLNKAGLLVTRKEGRRLIHKITPTGEEWCEEALATVETPPRAGALARVGFEWLRAIAGYLRKSNIRLSVVLGKDGGSIESLIRAAYSELSDEPQDWVRLAKLRPKLDGANKDEVDKVLLAMTRTGLVHLAQSANRKALTDADHAAAIRIGSEEKHLVAIEES